MSVSVRFLPHIEGPRETECFGRNILQDGYTEVHRGSANRNGLNSIIGRIFISRSKNNVRIRGKL